MQFYRKAAMFNFNKFNYLGNSWEEFNIHFTSYAVEFFSSLYSANGADPSGSARYPKTNPDPFWVKARKELILRPRHSKTARPTLHLVWKINRQ